MVKLRHWVTFGDNNLMIYFGVGAPYLTHMGLYWPRNGLHILFFNLKAYRAVFLSGFASLCAGIFHKMS